MICRNCSVLRHLACVNRYARSVRCLVCVVSWGTWLLFTGVLAPRFVLCVRCPGPLGSCSQVCSLCVLCCMCGVLGHLAPVQQCSRLVCCLACAVSWSTCLVCIVCSLLALCCACGVLGHLASVHRCARAVCCVACAVSWVTWLLFTGVPAWFVLWRVRCPAPLASCAWVCPLSALSRVCGVLRHSAPVHRCARSVRCVVCAVSWATWLLFTGVLAPSAVLLVRCPGPLGSCSPVHSIGVLCCVCAVVGHLALVHRFARSVRCPACAVCPGPLGSCPPVCWLGALSCVCGVLGHLAPVHRCIRSVGCFACAVSRATWLVFTGVLCCVLVVLRSGQVISSPPGPSGGPSKRHFLPGGGVSRVPRARSPVPPRLPRFATPRSVHQFAAVAAGAYPPPQTPRTHGRGTAPAKAVVAHCATPQPLG